MNVFLLAGLLGLGTAANAANLSIDFTQSPTLFNADANWEFGFSSTDTTFTGEFFSVGGTDGSSNIAIVDQYTGAVLDELLLNFSALESGGGLSIEQLSGSVLTGLNLPTVPAGFVSVLATGAPVDFTAAISNIAGNITLEATQNSSPAPVPEPASFELLGLGASAFMFGRRYLMKRLA